MNTNKNLNIVSPDPVAHEAFDDAGAAVERLQSLYREATGFLCEQFGEALRSGRPEKHYRAFYPEIRFTATTYAAVDSRLSFGHVTEPGTYSTTITRPDLFAKYLTQQISLLIENHGLPVMVGLSMVPMPVHFAVASDASVTVPQEGATEFILRDVFDVPDLATTNDDIVNGFDFTYEDLSLIHI